MNTPATRESSDLLRTSRSTIDASVTLAMSSSLEMVLDPGMTINRSENSLTMTLRISRADRPIDRV